MQISAEIIFLYFSGKIYKNNKEEETKFSKSKIRLKKCVFLMS